MMIDRMARHRLIGRTVRRCSLGARPPNPTKECSFSDAGSIGIGHVLNEVGKKLLANDFDRSALSFREAPLVADEWQGHKNFSRSPSKQAMLQVIGVPIPYSFKLYLQRF